MYFTYIVRLAWSLGKAPVRAMCGGRAVRVRAYIGGNDELTDIYIYMSVYMHALTVYLDTIASIKITVKAIPEIERVNVCAG